MCVIYCILSTAAVPLQRLAQMQYFCGNKRIEKDTVASWCPFCKPLTDRCRSACTAAKAGQQVTEKGTQIKKPKVRTETITTHPEIATASACEALSHCSEEALHPVNEGATI